ncbi:hypothetical protein AYI68_g5262 [Smittium mucronatum]|uniref:Uncharacterized protein n=1 Tax=Smittium mucronatum TaxID=133383 RepID=A0A1R0GUS9_9FUNG|nr:hypothetical protein AYI68_g5262 [Smittium mucronatum]
MIDHSAKTLIRDGIDLLRKEAEFQNQPKVAVKCQQYLSLLMNLSNSPNIHSIPTPNTPKPAQPQNKTDALSTKKKKKKKKKKKDSDTNMPDSIHPVPNSPIQPAFENQDVLDPIYSRDLALLLAFCLAPIHSPNMVSVSLIIFQQFLDSDLISSVFYTPIHPLYNNNLVYNHNLYLEYCNSPNPAQDTNQFISASSHSPGDYPQSHKADEPRSDFSQILKISIDTKVFSEPIHSIIEVTSHIYKSHCKQPYSFLNSPKLWLDVILESICQTYSSSKTPERLQMQIAKFIYHVVSAPSSHKFVDSFRGGFVLTQVSLLMVLQLLCVMAVHSVSFRVRETALKCLDLLIYRYSTIISLAYTLDCEDKNRFKDKPQGIAFQSPEKPSSKSHLHSEYLPSIQSTGNIASQSELQDANCFLVLLLSWSYKPLSDLGIPHANESSSSVISGNTLLNSFVIDTQKFKSAFYLQPPNTPSSITTILHLATKFINNITSQTLSNSLINVPHLLQNKENDTKTTIPFHYSSPEAHCSVIVTLSLLKFVPGIIAGYGSSMHPSIFIKAHYLFVAFTKFYTLIDPITLYNLLLLCYLPKISSHVCPHTEPRNNLTFKDITKSFSTFMKASTEESPDPCLQKTNDTDSLQSESSYSENLSVCQIFALSHIADILNQPEIYPVLFQRTGSQGNSPKFALNHVYDSLCDQIKIGSSVLSQSSSQILNAFSLTSSNFVKNISKSLTINNQILDPDHQHQTLISLKSLEALSSLVGFSKSMTFYCRHQLNCKNIESSSMNRDLNDSGYKHSQNSPNPSSSDTGDHKLFPSSNSCHMRDGCVGFDTVSLEIKSSDFKSMCFLDAVFKYLRKMDCHESKSEIDAILIILAEKFAGSQSATFLDFYNYGYDVVTLATISSMFPNIDSSCIYHASWLSMENSSPLNVLDLITTMKMLDPDEKIRQMNKVLNIHNHNFIAGNFAFLNALENKIGLLLAPPLSSKIHIDKLGMEGSITDKTDCLKSTWPSIVASISQVYQSTNTFNDATDLPNVLGSYSQIVFSSSPHSTNVFTEKVSGTPPNEIYPRENTPSLNEKEYIMDNIQSDVNQNHQPNLLIVQSLKIIQDSIYIASRENLETGLTALLTTLIQMVGLTRNLDVQIFKSHLSVVTLIKVAIENAHYFDSEKWIMIMETLSLFYSRQYPLALKNENLPEDELKEFDPNSLISKTSNSEYIDDSKQEFSDMTFERPLDSSDNFRNISGTQYAKSKKSNYKINDDRFFKKSLTKNPGKSNQFFLKYPSDYLSNFGYKKINQHGNPLLSSQNQNDMHSFQAELKSILAKTAMEKISEFQSFATTFPIPTIYNYIRGVSRVVISEAFHYESQNWPLYQQSRPMIKVYNHRTFFDYVQVENVFYSRLSTSKKEAMSQVFSPQNTFDNENMSKEDSKTDNSEWLDFATDHSYNIFTTKTFANRNQSTFVNEIIPQQMVCTRLLFSFVHHLINSSSYTLHDILKYWEILSPALAKLSGYSETSIFDNKPEYVSCQKHRSTSSQDKQQKNSCISDTFSKISSVKVYGIESLGLFILHIMKKMSTITVNMRSDLEVLICPLKIVAELSENLHVQYTTLYIIFSIVIQYHSVFEIPWKLIFEIISLVLKKFIRLVVEYPVYGYQSSSEDIFFMVANYQYNNGSSHTFNQKSSNKKDMDFISPPLLTPTSNKSESLAYCRSSISKLSSRNVFLALEIIYYISDFKQVLHKSLEEYIKCVGTLTTALAYVIPSPGIISSFSIGSNIPRSLDIGATEGASNSGKYFNDKSSSYIGMRSPRQEFESDPETYEYTKESLSGDWKNQAELAIYNASTTSTDNAPYGISQIILSIWQSISEYSIEIEMTKTPEINKTVFPLLLITREVFRVIPLLPELLVTNDKLYDSIFCFEKYNFSEEFKNMLLSCVYKSSETFEEERLNLPMWEAFDYIRKKLFDLVIESFNKLIDKNLASEWFIRANQGFKEFSTKLLALPQTFLNLDQVFEPWIAFILKYNMIYVSNFDLIISQKDSVECFKSILDLDSCFLKSIHEQIYICGIETFGILIEGIGIYEHKGQRNPGGYMNKTKNKIPNEFWVHFTNVFESVVLSKCFWGIDSLEILSGPEFTLNFGQLDNEAKISNFKENKKSGPEKDFITYTCEAQESLKFESYYKRSLGVLKNIMNRPTFISEIRSRSEALIEMMRFVRRICLDKEINLLNTLYRYGMFELVYKWFRMIFITRSFARAVDKLTSRIDVASKSSSNSEYSQNEPIRFAKNGMKYEEKYQNSSGKPLGLDFGQLSILDNNKRDFAVRLENVCSFTFLDCAFHLYKQTGDFEDTVNKQVGSIRNNQSRIAEDIAANMVLSRWLASELLRNIELAIKSYIKALEKSQVKKEMAMKILDSFGETESFGSSNGLDHQNINNSDLESSSSGCISPIESEKDVSYYKDLRNTVDNDNIRLGTSSISEDDSSDEQSYFNHLDNIHNGTHVNNGSSGHALLNEYSFLPLPSLARLVIKSIGGLMELIEIRNKSTQSSPTLDGNEPAKKKSATSVINEDNNAKNINLQKMYVIIQMPTILALVADAIASTDHPEIKRLGALFIKSASSNS